MNEDEWLSCSDLHLMIQYLRGRTSDRKLRLFAVACCRRIEHLVIPEAREILDVARRFAEGTASTAERKQAREQAQHVRWLADPTTAHRRGPAKAAIADSLARRAWDAASATARRTIGIGALETVRNFAGEYPHNWTAASERQAMEHAELLRCITGNPFQRVDSDRLRLCDNTVVYLAQRIYDCGDFAALPVLGDALADAGCDSASVLDHCHQAKLHHAGCWVVDCVLGKE